MCPVFSSLTIEVVHLLSTGPDRRRYYCSAVSVFSVAKTACHGLKNNRHSTTGMLGGILCGLRF